MTTGQILSVNGHDIFYIESNADRTKVNPFYLRQEFEVKCNLEINIHPILHLEKYINGRCLVVLQYKRICTHLAEGGITMACKYSIFRLDQIRQEDNSEKYDLYREMMDILMKKGLTETQTLCLVNNLFLTDEILRFNKCDLLDGCRNLDVEKYKTYYANNIIKNGESPLLIVNSYFESACQKSLNVKHKKFNAAEESKQSLTIYPSAALATFNQFYFLLSPNLAHMFRLSDAYLDILRKKPYITAYRLNCDGTMDIPIHGGNYLKKFNNFCKKGNIETLELPFNHQELCNVQYSNLAIKQKGIWYYNLDDEAFLNIDAHICKAITMETRTKYDEYRLLVKSEYFDNFLRYCECASIVKIYNEYAGVYNCSIYVLNVIGNLEIFFEKLNAFNAQFSTTTPVIQMIYTNVIKAPRIKDPQVIQDNTLRLLFMKTTGSNDPYPKNYDQMQILIILKIEYAMSKHTKIKMAASKYPFEGPFANVLSERGLMTVADVNIHDKEFIANSMSSSVFFNTLSKTNLNNENLPVALP